MRRDLSSSRAPHARVPGAVPPGVREPMPSVWFSLVITTLGTIALVINLVGLASGIDLASILWITWNLITIGWGFLIRHSVVHKRAELREKNYDAVEDWIISASLPAASDELVKREREDARAYRELMAKQGKRPDGSQAPDPNSNRSKKRAARKERARQRRQEREFEEQFNNAMNLPPMLTGTAANSFVGYHAEKDPLPGEDSPAMRALIELQQKQARKERLTGLMDQPPLDTRWYP
jgi:hypothetical protein